MYQQILQKIINLKKINKSLMQGLAEGFIHFISMLLIPAHLGFKPTTLLQKQQQRLKTRAENLLQKACLLIKILILHKKQTIIPPLSLIRSHIQKESVLIMQQLWRHFL